MRKIAVLVLALIVAPFLVGFKRGAVEVTGRAQLGVSTGGIYKNIMRGWGINSSLLTSFPTWPSVLDTNGYPNNGGPPSNFTSQVLWPSNITTSTVMVVRWQGTGAFYLNTAAPGLTVLSATAGTTSSDCGSLASLPKVCGFGARFAGTDVRVTFTVNGSQPSGGWSMSLPSGTYTNMSNLILARLVDEAAVLAESDPADVFTDDFVNYIRQANPKVFRTLGLLNVNNGNNVTTWTHRPHWKDALSYTRRIPPTLYAGLITNTGSDVYTVSAPSGFSSLTDGATIIGYVDTTNSTRYPTLNVGGTGAKRLINSYGQYPSVTIGGTVAVSDTISIVFNATNLPGGTQTLNYVTTGTTTTGAALGLAAAINANATLTTAGFYASYTSGSAVTLVYSSAAGLPTFSGSATGAETITVTGYMGISGLGVNVPGTMIFDVILDAWIWTTDASTAVGGITYQTPMESMIALANRTNKHIWVGLPCHANDSYFTDLANYIATNLNRHLLFYAEFCNEIWNPGAAFDQTAWSTAKGQRLGFAAGDNRPFNGHYGLRTKQISDIMSPIVGSQLRRVIAFQAAGATGSTNLYRMQGADLRNSLTSPGGQSFYQELVGVDYNATPNRPIDITEVISYADYMSGPQITNQFTTQTTPYDVGGPNTYTSVADGSTITNTTFGGWVEAADNYASGEPQRKSNALQFLDWDVRQGIKPRNSVTSISASGCALVTASGNHSLLNGYPVAFNTTGTFDSAITKGKNYFVISTGLTATQFQFSDTLNGACVTVSGASTGTITWGTVGGETYASIASYAANYYGKWQPIAAGYDGGAQGRPVAMGNVAVELYEGSYEAWYPTAGTCSNFGISADYCGSTGKVAVMLEAYKYSSLFYQFQADHYTSCMAQANTQTCTWFQSNGPNQWSILSSDYSGYMSGSGTSNAYSSYLYFQHFNANP